MLPFLVAELPPLYDYYQWVFQGHIVNALLFGSQVGSEALASSYELTLAPIPNSAAPAVIALLGVVFSAPVAGRVFLALCVLLFAYGFAYMVRSVQQQPTAVEVLGFVWAFGYFMYKGYDSYLFSLAVAFFAIGKLHRGFISQGGGPRRSDLALLSVLGIALYLCHLMGWLVFALAVGVYSVWLLRRGKGQGGLLLATLVPSIVLLAWYAWYTLAGPGSSGGTHVLWYQLWTDKIVSLLEPLMPFQRTDPFTSPVSAFWLNVIGLLLLAGLVGGNLDLSRSGKDRGAWPLRVVASILTVAALLMPFLEFAGQTRPDERLLFPALLIGLASLPYRTLTVTRGVVAGSIVALIIGLHVIEYGAASRQMAGIQRVIAGVVTPGVPVLALAVHSGPTRGDCVPEPGLTFGAPTLKWFELNRLLVLADAPQRGPRIQTGSTGGTMRVPISETSLVRVKPDAGDKFDLAVLQITPEQAQQPGFLAEQLGSDYAYIEVFGCPADVAAAQQALAPRYTQAAQGKYFAVLRGSTSDR